MKKCMLVIAAVAFLGAAGIVLSQTSTPTAKGNPDVQQQKGKTAPAVPIDLKTKEGEVSKTSAKPDPVAERKKKAQNLLNRCYQEALESEPQVKMEALTRIAESMSRIDQKRGLFIYEQAFLATKDTKNSGRDLLRSMNQARIIEPVMRMDLDKGLQMAFQIERSSGDASEIDSVAMAIGRVAASLAEKNPERAYGIVHQVMTHGWGAFDVIPYVAEALQKARPDLAEMLYVEAIHQFDKPSPSAHEVVGFVTLVSRLFDLNRVLTAQSLEMILKAIDYLGDHPPKQDMRFDSFDGKTRTSFSGIRDYAIVMTVAMMRRLDPDRAMGLEEKFSDYREKIAVEAARQASQRNLSAQAPSGISAQNPPTAASASTPFSYSTLTPFQRDSSRGAPPARDLSPWWGESMSLTQMKRVVSSASDDPEAALEEIQKMEPGPYRIKGMVGIAEAICMSNPEKAKSLLKEAASETEKLPQPYDRAECDAVVGEGFLPFDQDRSQQLIGEAFKIADKMAEDEKEWRANPKRTDLRPDPYHTSVSVFPQLYTSLSKFNIDAAIARADEIKDKGSKLRILVQIADAILSQK